MPQAGATLLWLLDGGALGEGALAGYAGWLGASERERCARFVRPARRRQFIAGRALVRLALGRLLGMPAPSIAFEERRGRAPALAVPAPARCPAGASLSFSISHSGPWVACAASTAAPIGLDIERIDPARDVLALAAQAFRQETVARLAALEGDLRLQAFYRRWCLHEADIKLGSEGGAGYVFEQPGLMVALRSARPLAAAPALRVVALDPAGRGLR